MVNVVNDFLCLGLSMGKNEVLIDPRNDVVFKITLNDLVKQVWQQEVMDICPWEMLHEWLIFNQR